MIPVEKLIAQIAESVGLDATNLSPDTLIDEIGLNSLALAQVLAALEAEFSINFTEEALIRFLEARSIGDCLDVLNSCLAS